MTKVIIDNSFASMHLGIFASKFNLPSCPPDFGSSDLTHPFTPPPLKGGEKEGSHYPSPIGEGATHVANSNNIRRAAFTLAEVLITLGIIGVVAAMTIPNIVSKYQKKVLVSQFKKSYASVQNAINMTIAENGTPYECYNMGFGGYHVTDCAVFWNDLLKQMKVIKTCNYAADDKECGQVSYKTKEQVLAEGGSITNSSCSFLDYGARKVNILSDGSYIINYGGSDLRSHHNIYFAIDTNGAKGPNKWGYDLFYMVLNRESMSKDVVVMDEVCAIKEKGGYYVSEIMQE